MSEAEKYIINALASGALNYTNLVEFVFFFQGHSQCVPGIVDEPLTLDSKPGGKTLRALSKVLQWERTHIDPLTALQKRVETLEKKTREPLERISDALKAQQG